MSLEDHGPESPRPDPRDHSLSRNESSDSKLGVPPKSHCYTWGCGHKPHYIAANKSIGQPHHAGRLADVDGNLVVVDFGDEFEQYFNHSTAQVLANIGLWGRVYMYGWLLKSTGGHCFSLLPTTEQWESCEYRSFMERTSDVK